MAGSLERKGVLKFETVGAAQSAAAIGAIARATMGLTAATGAQAGASAALTATTLKLGQAFEMNAKGLYIHRGLLAETTAGTAKANTAFGGLTRAAGVLAAAYVALHGAQQMMKWGEEAARARDVETAFEGLSKQAGRSADEYLAAMDRAAKGTIADTELMKQANYAAMLGVQADLGKIIEIARATSKATGQSVQYMTESLVIGIGRQSRLWLDNLGIIVDADKAYADMAASLGKTVKQLTEAERKLAFANVAIAEGMKTVAALGGGENATDPFARLSASSKDLGEALKDNLVPVLGAVAEGLAAVNEAWAKYLRENAGKPPAVAGGFHGDVVPGGSTVLTQMAAEEAAAAARSRNRGANISNMDWSVGLPQAPWIPGGKTFQQMIEDGDKADAELLAAQQMWKEQLLAHLDRLARDAKLRPGEIGAGGFGVPKGFSTPGAGMSGFDSVSDPGLAVPGGPATQMHVADVVEYAEAMGTLNTEMLLFADAAQMAGEMGAAGMNAFVDATINAVRGTKGAYAELGKVMLKWAADSLKSIAAQAASKALFSLAEGFMFSAWGNTASASAAFTAAAQYGAVAGSAGSAAIAIGAVSANNAPSSGSYSQDQRNAMSPPLSESGSARTESLSVTRVAPTNITVIHNNYGNQYFRSEAQADALSIAEVIDTGNLYPAEAQ